MLSHAEWIRENIGALFFRVRAALAGSQIKVQVSVTLIRNPDTRHPTPDTKIGT